MELYNSSQINIPWFVVYVKPRNEKKAAQQLQDLGLTVYCPLITQIRQWSDRKKKVETPLIPSYIFVKLEESRRDIVFQVPGVLRYLFWLGKPAIARHEEIVVMQQWLQNDLQEVQIGGIQLGDTLSITKGPFKGKEGIVQQTSNNRLQLVLLELGIKITLTKPKVA